MRYARLAAVAAAASATAVLAVAPVQSATGDGQPPDPTAVPGVVTIVSAGPAGGSGEVMLTWDAVTNAMGYRVPRSDAADGQFEIVADLDVTTGSATAAADVVNIYSDQHSYVPARGTLDGPDRSPRFSYVDLGSEQRCFRVIAYNAAGDGPASVVACGAPPGVEPEPATPVPAEPNFTG